MSTEHESPFKYENSQLHRIDLHLLDMPRDLWIPITGHPITRPHVRLNSPDHPDGPLSVEYVFESNNVADLSHQGLPTSSILSARLSRPMAESPQTQKEPPIDYRWDYTVLSRMSSDPPAPRREMYGIQDVSESEHHNWMYRMSVGIPRSKEPLTVGLLASPYLADGRTQKDPLTAVLTTSKWTQIPYGLNPDGTMSVLDQGFSTHLVVQEMAGRINTGLLNYVAEQIRSTFEPGPLTLIEQAVAQTSRTS